MPFEPTDELTFTLTAAEAQHLINTMQQTYQTSFQIVMKLNAQAQAQMQLKQSVHKGNSGVSDTVSSA